MTSVEDKKEYKVSVIIPVWNPEKSKFSRCLNSILSQTLKEIEIIAVDDCGGDNSIEIAEIEALKDKRIKIIHNEENIGSGPSRNKGIEIAKGEYLSFIDADDYIEKDYYELLYKKAKENNLDIVKGKSIYEKEDGTVLTKTRQINALIKKGLKNNPLFVLFYYEHHVALYRREMVVKNNVTYGTTKRSQDTTFLLRVCIEAKSFDLEEQAKYHFCERETSAMHQLDEASILGVIYSLDEQIKTFKDKNIEEKYANNYLKTRISSALREISRYENVEGVDINKLMDELINVVKKYPYYLKIKEKSVAIKALLDYKELLPTGPFKLPWEEASEESYLTLIESWVNFYIKHPELRKKTLIELSAKVASAKIQGVNNKIIKKALNKLSVRDRLLVNGIVLSARMVPQKARIFIKQHLFK